MKLGFQYGTRYIEFKVQYRNRKTMSIEVDSNGDIIVIAPMNTEDTVIINKVKSKAAWIVQKQYEVRNINVNKINREAVSGESYLYLGRNYTMQLFNNNDENKIFIRLFRGKFIVNTYTSSEEKIKEALEKWYRQKALLKIRERIKYYEPYFEEKVHEVKVKEQKKRWASCTNNNVLLFNWRCVMAPVYILDYIVVHEMCHMRYKNHSKEFWEYLYTVMPDYEARREYLRDNGIKFDL